MPTWQRKPKSPWQIEFQAPGYGRGRFSISSGTITRITADAYETHLHTLYTKGHLDVLDLVKQKTIPLPKLKQLMDATGVQGLLTHIRKLEEEKQEEASELTGLLEEFLNSPSRKAGESTYNDYRVQVSWLLRWLTEQLRVHALKDGQGRPPSKKRRKYITVADLTKDNISEWLRTVEKTPSERYADKRERQPKTVNHHRAAVSAFCGWLVEKGHLKTNPCKDAYRAKEVKAPPVYMNRVQWSTFRGYSLQYDEQRVKRWETDPKMDHTRPYPCTLFWDFLVATGATSYNEGCKVRMADVYSNESPGSEMVRVHLPGTKTDARSRDVFINRLLAERLGEFAAQHERGYFEPIFPWGKNEAFHVWSGVKQLLMAAKEKWIEPVRVYDLRHTYAVNMIIGDRARGIPGVDIVTLQNLMGHTRIETTMIYARHVGDHAREGCMVLHRLLGL